MGLGWGWVGVWLVGWLVGFRVLGLGGLSRFGKFFQGTGLGLKGEFGGVFRGV